MVMSMGYRDTLGTKGLWWLWGCSRWVIAVLAPSIKEAIFFSLGLFSL